jgi:hypothetical protein
LECLVTHIAKSSFKHDLACFAQDESVHLFDLTSVTECCNNAFFISGSVPHNKFKIYIF